MVEIAFGGILNGLLLGGGVIYWLITEPSNDTDNATTD